MQLAVVQRILGILLSLFSFTMVPPMLVSLIYNDDTLLPFITAFFTILGFGLLLWFPVRNIKNELRLRDGFIVVVLFWAGLGLTGSVPLILAEAPNLSLTDAVFESISGLTNQTTSGTSCPSFGL